MLRYGVNVQAEVTEKKKMVHLIDWANPMENDFQIAEEVTIQGESDRRPDLVVYVNGIALVVIELKRSTVSAHEGIRQNIRNQQDGYIPRFFTTIQLLFAGNDTEGLHYGVITFAKVHDRSSHNYEPVFVREYVVLFIGHS